VAVFNTPLVSLARQGADGGDVDAVDVVDVELDLFSVIRCPVPGIEPADDPDDKFKFLFAQLLIELPGLDCEVKSMISNVGIIAFPAGVV